MSYHLLVHHTFSLILQRNHTTIIPSNVIPANPVKMSSSSNTNSSQSQKDKKTDKMEAPVVSHKNIDSQQQNGTHNTNHEKIQENPKNEKRNHNS